MRRRLAQCSHYCNALVDSLGEKERHDRLAAYRDCSYSLIFAFTLDTIELNVRFPLSAICPIVRWNSWNWSGCPELSEPGGGEP